MEPYCLKPTQTLSAVDTLKKEKGYTAFPITSTGRVGGELLGILTSRDSDFVEDRNTPIEQCMTKKDNLVTANDGCTLEDAQNIFLIKVVQSRKNIMDNKLQFLFKQIPSTNSYN